MHRVMSQNAWGFFIFPKGGIIDFDYLRLGAEFGVKKRRAFNGRHVKMEFLERGL